MCSSVMRNFYPVATDAKADTGTFLTWQLENATACGYRLPELHPSVEATSTGSTAKPLSLRERLREKVAMKALRRDDKKTTGPDTTPTQPRHVKITTKKLLLSAESIVCSRKKVELPDSMAKVLQPSIDKRKGIRLVVQGGGVSEGRVQQKPSSLHHHT